MPLPLKPGAPLDNAIQGLRQAAMEGRNPLPMGFAESMNHYLSWVSGQAEVVLRNYFSDMALSDRLRGDAFWNIQRMTADHPRWGETIRAEMRRQSEDLEALGRELQALKARLDAAPGGFAVLDTHLLLHFEPPSQIPWPELLRQDDVRLVLPLRVVEELDEKKYTARDDLADRARRLLAQLRPALSGTGGLPVPLQDHVTVEVPVEDGPRSRSADADYEVLLTCRELQCLGRRIVLVTGDTGLAIRAANSQVEQFDPPEKYLRRRTSKTVGQPPGS